ncbi:MAG TPA: hypothetical protein VF185_01570 [Patescibacteria group bacterium]
MGFLENYRANRELYRHKDDFGGKGARWITFDSNVNSLLRNVIVKTYRLSDSYLQDPCALVFPPVKGAECHPGAVVVNNLITCYEGEFPKGMEIGFLTLRGVTGGIFVFGRDKDTPHQAYIAAKKAFSIRVKNRLKEEN